MRRLVVFGTGAAIVGIVLLVVAFFESYIIVSSLQNEIATNTTPSNGVFLEDTTLEAVFLGVMAALGYGLIAQGLAGIRKEEYIELQGPATRVAERVEQKKRETVQNEAVVRQVQPRPRVEPMSAPPRVVIVPPTIASVRADEEVPATRTQAAQVAADQLYASALQRAAAAAVPQVPSPSVAAPRNDGPAVVWEGGPPPKLEGVEVLPEPPEHGAPILDKPPVVVRPPPPPPVKRGRGRPKGSKNRSDNGTSNSQNGSMESDSQGVDSSQNGTA